MLHPAGLDGFLREAWGVASISEKRASGGARDIHLTVPRRASNAGRAFPQQLESLRGGARVKVLAALFSGVLGLVFSAAVVVGGPAEGSAPSALALQEIPPDLLTVYVNAASTCAGLPWQVLAAIGYTESRHAQGHADPQTGDVSPPIFGPSLDGTHGTERIADPSSADGWMHAQGPMQFLPSTWARWARLAPNRPRGAIPSPQNAWDAVYSAAAYLCSGRSQVDNLEAAILSYSHSRQSLAAVLQKARDYGLDASGDSPLGEAAVAEALKMLGVPYVYGAGSPNVGFDCSGLMQWAYAQVGVRIPRVTYDQVHAGTAVAITELRAGDLIFTRGDVPVRDFGHVGMYVGNDIEVVAPHSGAVVRLQHVDIAAVQAVRRVA